MFCASAMRLSWSPHQERAVELRGVSDQGTTYCAKDLMEVCL